MDPTRMGKNRTGVQMSPKDAAAQLDVPDQLRPVDNNAPSAFELRREQLQNAEPVGSVPPPGTLKGVVKAGGQMLGGNRLQAFIDKVGERLAFERAGTRLYDGFIEKCAVREDEADLVDMEVLKRFRNQEMEHFLLLSRTLEKLGGDPTAQTPCANVTAVASAGLLQAVRDPRTSVTQSLQALLTAELVDTAGWELLYTLAREHGFDDIAEEFMHASDQEAEHLLRIRNWYEEAVLNLSRHAA